MDKPKPTQADRDAAADIYCDWFSRGDDDGAILAGYSDNHWMVQFCMRHRLLGQREMQEMAAKVAYMACAETRHVTLGQKAENAIRAIDTEEPGQ